MQNICLTDMYIFEIPECHNQILDSDNREIYSGLSGVKLVYSGAEYQIRAYLFQTTILHLFMSSMRFFPSGKKCFQTRW